MQYLEQTIERKYEAILPLWYIDRRGGGAAESAKGCCHVPNETPSTRFSSQDSMDLGVRAYHTEET